MLPLNSPIYSLAYVVTLAGHQLSTDLHVINTGNAPFEFQALFHSYIKAPAEQVLVSSLNGLKYFDKVAKETKTESRDGVDVKNFTDSVYENAPGNYKVVWPSGGIEVKTKNFKDVVVWNPRETGSSMSDMEHEGWCVFTDSTRRHALTSPLSQAQLRLRRTRPCQRVRGGTARR